MNEAFVQLINSDSGMHVWVKKSDIRGLEEIRKPTGELNRTMVYAAEYVFTVKNEPADILDQL